MGILKGNLAWIPDTKMADTWLSYAADEVGDWLICAVSPGGLGHKGTKCYSSIPLDDLDFGDKFLTYCWWGSQDCIVISRLSEPILLETGAQLNIRHLKNILELHFSL